MLHYNDETFFKFLLAQLARQLGTAAASEPAKWLAAHEASLGPIISSLGMLQLRDEALLDQLTSLLTAGGQAAPPQLVVSFVQTCAALAYLPGAAAQSDEQRRKVLREQLIAGVDVSAALATSATRYEKLRFLNFVWSLCCLGAAREDLVAAVLSSTFVVSMLSSEPT